MKWYEVKTAGGKVVDTRKHSPKGDALDEGIKKLESAAQTPSEKGKRRKRMHQSRAHRVS